MSTGKKESLPTLKSSTHSLGNSFASANKLKQSKSRLIGSVGLQSRKKLPSIELLSEGNTVVKPSTPSKTTLPSSLEENETNTILGQAEIEWRNTLLREQEALATRIKALPLPYQLLKKGLSCLGPSPNGLRHVYLRLSLPNEHLENLSFLKNYIYLQRLELSGNEISDVSILSNMKYLVQVDLSNNHLETVLFDPPPNNLQYVDYSRNRISIINDLSKYRFLKSLCLDSNSITQITGLSGCKYLKHLSVAKNNLSCIEGLDNLSITFLDLSFNKISSLNGLSTLKDLEVLKIHHNKLHDISTEFDWGPGNHPFLKDFDLSFNNLTNPEEILTLVNSRLLRDLKLEGNPLTEVTIYLEDPTRRKTDMVADKTKNFTNIGTSSYRLYILYILPQLSVLDGFAISPEEKISALNQYKPPPKVVSSLEHSRKMQKQLQLYAKIKNLDRKDIKPIVLCGPSGVGKRTLIGRLLEEFPHLYGSSISHTTRKPKLGEIEGVQYHFTTKAEMEEMIEQGMFIEVVTLFGNYYGISIESINKVNEEGKICVIDLEIEGVIHLKRSALKAHYIRISAPSIDALQARLIQRKNKLSLLANSKNSGNSETDEIQQWVAKAEASMLEEIDGNGEKFFDLSIVNDDLERAYKTLKEYCLKNY